MTNINIPCPVCGKYVFARNYEICRICQWENDGAQNDDPDCDYGANQISLNTYRLSYQLENNPATEKAAKAARQIYKAARRDIYTRYKDINHVTDVDDSTKMHQELCTADATYTAALHAIANQA